MDLIINELRRNERKMQKSQNRICQYNELVFLAPQIARGKRVAGENRWKPHKKMQKVILLQKKRTKNLP